MRMPQPVETGRMSRKLQVKLALLKARLALATGSIAQHRIFGHVADDVWFLLNTAAYRRYGFLRRLLPGLPDPQIQREFIGSEGDRALREAFRAYQLIRYLCVQCGHPVTRQSAILDFGCGWGRTIRFFLRDAPAGQLHGADVMKRAVELSRETNPWCQFSQVPPVPPSSLPSDTFDLIYLYSVFSHLSEEAHDRWLSEFHRILRPDGLLFATTWPRHYLERCELSRQGDVRGGTHPGSALAFEGTEGWLRRYDGGEYCHSAIGGGDSLSSDFYGESCIPESYVRRRWSDRFAVRNYVEADDDWLWQNLIVAQRR